MSSLNVSGRRPVGRKFVVACDGTWQNSDQGVDTSPFTPPQVQIPTNVTRIIRALNHRDENGVTQIAFYQRGLGTDNFEDKLVGGLTGNDIAEHIREAYAFLANNFNPETQQDLDDVSKPLDQIVLLGFSRGAYTARAIASLVSDVGLLTKLGMENFWTIFGDWMKQDVDGEQSQWFLATYPDVARKFQQATGRRIALTDKEYRNTLIQNGLTRWGMPIRAVGVWDTVGALGIPMPWNSKNVKPFSFVNTKVPRAVQHAFHALAIDEHRNLFTPTLWEQPDQGSGQEVSLRKLKQCWFPGSHSNIGGSYPDAGISNITLAWMISQLEEHDGGILSFSPAYLDYVQDLNAKFYASESEPTRPWGFGKLYDSSLVTDPVSLANSLRPITRTPGRYHRVSTGSGKQTSIPLVGTGECIHRCVRVRIDGGGRGPEEPVGSTVDKLFNAVKQAAGLHPDRTEEGRSYQSPALSNYALVEPGAGKTTSDQLALSNSEVYWRGRDGLGDLPEDRLGSTEMRFLRRSVAAL
ncbi:hypothetical protein QTJ16_000063 [Diplocarpon rosae]|uniref:T6SS Phospholipase effector Tle1-like catalytic domain-containing protein n=1 Tax=Diplocarpon rosae TaxID=946125 RepID=A0AAD9T3A9_9HELO|nr:hypothetical protein QTJ16_000063 [Diplocarpon rosae]